MTRPRSVLRLSWLPLATVFALESAPASAEPYLAVRTGFKCSQCHVSPTGGGKRTDFGVIYSQTTLPMTHFRPAGEPGYFSGKLLDRISIGADYRADFLARLDTEDGRGNVVPGDTALSTSQATVYLQVDVVPEKVSFYLDQRVAPSGVNREIYALVRGLPLASYVKAGRTLLPYGLRLLDDDAFIRNRTGYTYERHEPGVEVGLEPGPLSFVANATENQLSLTGATTFRRFRVGASYGEDLNGLGRFVRGAFAGVSFGRFTLLGEGDWITDGALERFAALAELDFLLARGMNVKLAYEVFDRDVSAPNVNQERFTVGVEPFLTQFLQVGIFYRVNRGGQTVSENQDRLTVQLHGFF